MRDLDGAGEPSAGPDGNPGFNLKATSGSGTEDDPYSGTVTESGSVAYVAYKENDIYVEHGTIFNVKLASSVDVYKFDIRGDTLTVTEESGYWYLRGTADQTESPVLVVYLTSGSIGCASVIYVVSTTPELVFTSSPSDGVIEYV